MSEINLDGFFTRMNAIKDAIGVYRRQGLSHMCGAIHKEETTRERLEKGSYALIDRLKKTKKWKAITLGYFFLTLVAEAWLSIYLKMMSLHPEAVIVAMGIIVYFRFIVREEELIQQYLAVRKELQNLPDTRNPPLPVTAQGHLRCAAG